MNFSRMAAVLSLAVVIVACAAEPQTASRSSNGVTQGVLTVIRGCEVYQIDRGGISNPIFTTICPPESGFTASTAYDESCGKNCTNHVQVQTVTAPSQLGGQVEKPYKDRLVR